MNEDQLRNLIREVVARRLSSSSAPAEPLWKQHVSHGRLPMLAGIDLARSSASGSNTACLIEPAVACNHCGYCQSLGH